MGAKGPPRCGPEGKPSHPLKPLGSLTAQELGFPQLFFLRKFVGKFQKNSSCLCVSGRDGSLLKPEADAEAASLCRHAVLVPRAGPVPPGLPALQLPGLILSRPPGATFVADSIWFQRALRGAVGPLGMIPPISHVKSDLQAALAGARAQPQTGCPCSPHCLRARRLFPADLPASGEM